MSVDEGTAAVDDGLRPRGGSRCSNSGGRAGGLGGEASKPVLRQRAQDSGGVVAGGLWQTERQRRGQQQVCRDEGARLGLVWTTKSAARLPQPKERQLDR